VAAFHFNDAGCHTLRHGPLRGWGNHPAIGRDQVPARLALPGGPGDNNSIDRHLAKTGVKVQVGSIVNLLDTQIALVEAEDGIASFRRLACQRAATEKL
jgi:DNA-binding transcriptional LysR family regulator